MCSIENTVWKLAVVVVYKSSVRDLVTIITVCRRQKLKGCSTLACLCGQCLVGTWKMENSGVVPVNLETKYYLAIGQPP